MKKKVLVAVLFAIAFLTSMISNVKANPAASETTVESLVKHPEAFNGLRVAVQGFLVRQQFFAESDQYYLRDEKSNMISVGFSEDTDVSNFKKIKATGVFKAVGKDVHLMVEEVTALEAAPESQLVSGAQSTIVLMAYFSNRVNTKLQGDVYRMIFNDVNGYYAEASYDWLWITGSWDLWRNMGNTVGYYGADSGSTVDPHGWWIIRDAVTKADASVNFALYSKIIVVDAGPNQESSGVSTDLWSSRWSGLSIATGDGVTITHGMYVPDIEKSPYGVLGVQAHEYGHELGLPDLYTYPSNILEYDLMDRGGWNNLGNTPSGFTSWSKMQQGWIMSGQIHNVALWAGEYLRLDPLEDAGATISVIKVPYSTSFYFLIEARRKVGFDAYIPQEAVLVLYVNALTNRPYRYATLGVGGRYEYGNFGIMVMGQDLEGWSYNVYVWNKPWTADMRLTNNAYPSEINYGHKTVATVGGNVYVTWEDARIGGDYKIYFKRSTTYGSSWQADQQLTTNAARAAYPSIAAYGSYVYIAWWDTRDGANGEIYFKRSENYGQVWYGDQRLTVNTASSLKPSVAVSGRYVYVVWYDLRDGNSEIYFKRSTDNGLTWGADTRLTFNASASEFPNVAAVGANVYVAWQDKRNINWDIYFKRSTNYGATWGSDTRLTTSTADQVNPSIAAWGYDVDVVWTDNRYGASNTEIFLRRSLNLGVSWLSEMRLTNNAYLSTLAVVAVMGKSVYVVWEDNRTGTWEIYFKESPNRGLYWTPDRRLSATPTHSQWPSIAVGGADWNDVYVAWSDLRDVNYEIYFKYRW